MGGNYLNNKGFTLTEAIIIVVVVSIFLSALLPFIVENLTLNPRSKKRLLAYESAYAEVESLRLQDFATLENTTFPVDKISGATGSVVISTVDLDGDSIDESDIYDATVTVTYPDRGENKTITLNTLIADGGISGN